MHGCKDKKPASGFCSTHTTLPTHLLSQGHGSVIETVSIAVDSEPAPVPVSTLT